MELSVGFQRPVSSPWIAIVSDSYILEYQPVACKAVFKKRKGGIWRNLSLMIPHHLPSHREHLHCIPTHPGPVCPALSPHALVMHPVFPTTVLFLSMFSSWKFFFCYSLTPTCHIASLVEILFFKVFSISLAQTSLWAPPCAIIWPPSWFRFPWWPSLGFFFVFYL